MAKDIKDIVYAGFAQMGYLNWMRIPEGTNVMDALFNEEFFNKIPEDNNVKTRCLFACYTEDGDYQVPIWGSEFEKWELFYAANDLKLMSDLFGSGLIKSRVSDIGLNLEDYKKSNGFYASAFLNKETEQIIIVYRGTDDIADKLTDIDICLFNKYNPQLVNTYWFLRHVQWKLKEAKMAQAKIYFTGHSLGGALAQFAHIITNNNVNRTCTFNALGIGVFFINHFDTPGLINNLTLDICKNTSVKYGPELITFINDIWKSGVVLTDTWDVYDRVYNYLLSSNVHNASRLFKLDVGLNISFGFNHIDYDEKATVKEKLDVEKIKLATMELVGMLKAIALFKRGFTHSRNIRDYNIINYVFPDDWTVNLQTRIGKIIDVTKEKDYHMIEKIDDGALRVVLQTFKRFGFSKHSVGNFLMYITNNGYIIPGKIRSAIIEIMLKELCTFCIENKGFDEYIIKKVSTNEYRVNTIEYFTPDRLLRHGSAALRNLTHKQLIIDAISKYNHRTIGDNKIVYGEYNNMYLNGIIGGSAIVLED